MKTKCNSFGASRYRTDPYDSEIQKRDQCRQRRLAGGFFGGAKTADSKRCLLGDGYGPGDQGTVATLILSKTGVNVTIPQVISPDSSWITPIGLPRVKLTRNAPTAVWPRGALRPDIANFRVAEDNRSEAILAPCAPSMRSAEMLVIKQLLFISSFSEFLMYRPMCGRFRL